MLHGLVASVLVACAALPCLAQSLETASSAVSIEKLAIDASVDEGVALVELDETFRNHGDGITEGVFSLRLPADAVVASFSMWMQGKEKTGRVLEAQQARRVYDSIVSKRKDPGLVEQTGWRDFRVSVFPIPARDTVRVRMRYAYVLPDDLGLETLEVPLPAKSGPVGDLRIRTRVTAAHGLSSVDSPSHPGAKITLTEGRGEVAWSADGATPAGPFVLRMVPHREGFDVTVLAHRTPGTGADGPAEGWFTARVVPHLAEPPRIARDVVFVLDRSGSMEGIKIEQARAALLSGIGTLRPQDRFDVITFASDVTVLQAGALLPATPENLDAARRVARAISASGGTNIGGALAAALALRPDDASRLFAVVFLTDGDPTVGETDPARILADWRTRGAGTARLFAFGVGEDVKDFLLTRLAADGRGFATYVRRNADLEVKISALVDSVRTPLLLDPEVSVEGVGVEVLDREPSRLPDVFQGRALVLAGRFRGAGKAMLHLRGRTGGAPVDLAVPVDFGAAADRPHVAQIWAKLRVERLLDDLRASGDNAEIRREILRLGVRFQIVTPYTSFLVVEDGVHIPDPGEEARVPGESAPSAGGAATGNPSTGGGSAFGGRSRKSDNGPGVPPDSREPSDPPPAPEGGGPSTPGGEAAGGPTTGGPDAGGPSSAPAGGSGGGGGGPTTGARSRRSPSGFEDWTWWWRFSWQDVLATPSAPRVAASPETLAALRKFARDPGESFRVRSEAVMALASMGDVEIVPDLLRYASGTDAAAHPDLVRRSVLALGLVNPRTPAIREFLLATLRDSGRRAQFVRAFAAVALAMQPGDLAPRAALLAVLDDPAENDSNLRAACLVALGQLGEPAALPRLLDPQTPTDDVEAAYVAEAIGRIGRPGTAAGATDVADALCALVEKSPGGNAARSAVGALVRLVPRSLPDVQRRILKALAAALDHRDATVVGWAAIALGRAAGDASLDVSARTTAIDALTRSLGASLRAGERTYAALGLGVAVRSGVIPARTADDVRSRLRKALAAETEAPDRAAILLASGLARDEAALPALSAIRSDLTDAGRCEAALRTAALAGDPALAPDLVRVLRDPDASDLALRAAARAIGRVGTAATEASLHDAATDTAALPDLSRAFAVRAIRRLCGDSSPLDRAVEGLNFRAYVPAIADLLDVR